MGVSQGTWREGEGEREAEKKDGVRAEESGREGD